MLGLLNANEQLMLEKEAMSKVIKQFENDTQKLIKKNQMEEEELAMYREKLKILTERLEKMDAESKQKPSGSIGENSQCAPLEQPIDVVFTWVNGSDPSFQLELASHTGSLVKTHVDDLKAQRFQGKFKILRR